MAVPTAVLVSTLLEILEYLKYLDCMRNYSDEVSTLLEILGLVCLVVVGF